MFDAKLKRLFWAWHFWAGLIAGPVLLILAVTGGIYVFKPEIELWWYKDVATADFEYQSLQLEDLCDRVQHELGPSWTPYGLEIESFSGRAPALLVRPKEGSFKIRRFYIDPLNQRVLGELPERDLFTITLAIHRRLMAGTFGRVITELTTGWTIAITMLGLVLWWPRSWKKIRGVLLPRFKGKAYVRLRDLHSIGGAGVSLVLLSIAFSGLLFSLLWGGAFGAIGLVSGQFDVVVSPPQSKSSASASSLGVDKVLERARQLQMPEARMSIAFAQQPMDPITIESGHATGPSVSRIVHLDRVTGAVIGDQNLSELPPMAVYTQWCYPLHVGSFGGTVTKILWLVASIAIAALPILGFAMWRVRRKAGTTGFPNRVDVIKPRWFSLLVLGLGIALPTVGASMLLVALVGWLRHRNQGIRVAGLLLFFSIGFGEQVRTCQANDASKSAATKDLDRELGEIFRASRLQGCSIAIWKDDKSHTLTYGTMAMQRTANPDSIRFGSVTGNSRFAGGSISKLVTATLVLRALQADLLMLDDSVEMHLPGTFDSPWKNRITISMLLEHTAGLPGSSFADFATNQIGVAPIDYVRDHSPFDVQWEPGKHFSYANDGPVIAAAILEQVYGDDFDSIAKRELSTPLCMDSSDFGAQGYPRPRSFQENSQRLASQWLMPIRPAGAILTTPSDLLSLARMLANDGQLPNGESFLAAERVKRMRRGENSIAAEHGVGEGCFGLGSFPFIVNGHVLHGHFGKTETFSSSLGYHLPTRTAFALMVNSDDNASTAAMRRSIVNWMVGENRMVGDEEDVAAPSATEMATQVDFQGGLFVGATHKMASRRWLFGLLEARWVQPSGDGLKVTPFLPFADATQYVRVNAENGYRHESIPIPTAALHGLDRLGEEDESVWFVDGESFRQSSSWWVGVQMFALLGGPLVAFVVGLIGPAIVLTRWCRCRMKRHKFDRPSLPGMALVLSSIGLLAYWYLMVAYGIFGTTSEAALLGRISFVSIAATVASVAFVTCLFVALLYTRRLPRAGKMMMVPGVTILAAHAILLTANGWIPWFPR
ncbi:MAG: PepSY domain-containing protein [Planctomycetota bacterium]